MASVDLESLPSVTAEGGYKTKTGMIVGPNNFTGVSLTTFCNLIGGISINNSLRITASDNYSITFAYEQVNGGFITFDPVSGNEVQHEQLLTPVFAYLMNDLFLSVDDGPLRFGIIGPEGLVTASRYWIKSVVKIEILGK